MSYPPLSRMRVGPLFAGTSGLYERPTTDCRVPAVRIDCFRIQEPPPPRQRRANSR